MMYFTDRQEAALQLAAKIIKHKGPQTMVLAIPRGGVPIGCALAQALSAPLDLLMAKKIGHPFDPEFAIGAVRAINRQDPSSLIIAVPVCSVEAKNKLLPEVDELIACHYPDPFIGVGRFYRHFSQVTDEEVMTMLTTSTAVVSPSSHA